MTTPQRSNGGEQPVTKPTSGGDPVCWLTRVCPECGQFIEDADVDPESHCPTPPSPRPREPS